MPDRCHLICCNIGQPRILGSEWELNVSNDEVVNHDDIATKDARFAPEDVASCPEKTGTYVFYLPVTFIVSISKRFSPMASRSFTIASCDFSWRLIRLNCAET